MLRYIVITNQFDRYYPVEEGVALALAKRHKTTNIIALSDGRRDEALTQQLQAKAKKLQYVRYS